MPRIKLSSRALAVGFVSIIAVGVVVICPTRSHADAPAPGDSPAALAQLRQDRISTLRRAVDIAGRLYSQGIGTVDDVDRLDRLLVDAQLEASTSQKERIDVLTDALGAAKKQEETVSRLAAAGVATVLAPLEAKAYRLEIEIKSAEETAK